MRTRFVALIGAVLLLAGCGSGPAQSEATSQPLTLLPSADPFTSAIVATKALGTARLIVDVTHPDGALDTRGEGVTVLGSGQGDVTWAAGPTTYRELVNNRGVYVQQPPSTGGWEQWPAGHVSPTSGFVDSLRGLGVLREVTNAGPERLGTVDTTRHTGWLPLTSDEATRLGLSGEVAPEAREDVTVWIDSFGHAVRVERHAESTDDAVTARTDFSEFSVLLNLSSPSHDVTATRS
jgi:hypothetical protein